VGWAWFIFWVSSSPTPLGTDPNSAASFLDFLPREDLFAHGIVYAALAWLVMLTLLPIKLCKPINVSLRFVMPVVIAGVYGTAMEFVQDGIAERSAEALDVVADVTGALLTVAFMGYLWPKVKGVWRAVASRL
jgi:VanZ family protein